MHQSSDDRVGTVLGDSGNGPSPANRAGPSASTRRWRHRRVAAEFHREWRCRPLVQKGGVTLNKGCGLASLTRPNITASFRPVFGSQLEFAFVQKETSNFHKLIRMPSDKML